MRYTHFFAAIAFVLASCNANRGAVADAGYATHAIITLRDSAVVTGPLVRSDDSSVTVIIAGTEQRYLRRELARYETALVRSEVGHAQDVAEAPQRATNTWLIVSAVSAVLSILILLAYSP